MSSRIIESRCFDLPEGSRSEQLGLLIDRWRRPQCCFSRLRATVHFSVLDAGKKGLCSTFRFKKDISINILILQTRQIKRRRQTSSLEARRSLKTDFQRPQDHNHVELHAAEVKGQFVTAYRDMTVYRA